MMITAPTLAPRAPETMSPLMACSRHLPGDLHLVTILSLGVPTDVEPRVYTGDQSAQTRVAMAEAKTTGLPVYARIGSHERAIQFGAQPAVMCRVGGQVLRIHPDGRITEPEIVSDPANAVIGRDNRGYAVR